PSWPAATASSPTTSRRTSRPVCSSGPRLSCRGRPRSPRPSACTFSRRSSASGVITRAPPRRSGSGARRSGGSSKSTGSIASYWCVECRGARKTALRRIDRENSIAVVVSPARPRSYTTRAHAVLVAALALGLVVQPIVTEAQQAKKVWRIGFISVASMRIEESFFQELRALGYVEGRNLLVERRYSEGLAERFPEFAAELVRLKLDLIIATTTPAALAVKNATKTIPVVLPNSIDPVGVGLVASLAQPGGNIT